MTDMLNVFFLSQSIQHTNKITECNALRDRISEKRKDRCLFDQIYTKLERDICVLSRQMRRELEQGRDALELRKQTEKALAVAKSKLEEDKNALEMDRQQLDRLKKQLKEIEDASSSDRLKTTTPCTNSPVVTQVDDNHLNESDEEKQLDAALEQVKKLTCIDDVDELIARVTEADENNLSRFQHINLLNDEERKIQDDIINSKRMLEKVKSRGLDYNLQQLSELEHAKQEQQALDEKMESLSRQYNSQLELWQRMRDKIVDVHDSLDLTMSDDLLATDGVSESNVLAYLAEIEKVRRYTTITYSHSSLQNKSYKRLTAFISLRRKLQRSSQQLSPTTLTKTKVQYHQMSVVLLTREQQRQKLISIFLVLKMHQLEMAIGHGLLTS